MTIRSKITAIQKATATTLCIGLDTDIFKLPDGVEQSLEGMLVFNKTIIEATQSYCSSYKINTAFYEQYGSDGVALIEQTCKAIPESHIAICDAKRGDIGNTSKAYAKACFSLPFDAITVHPYMGCDSVEPFLEHENKIVFVLALTSNRGSNDFQYKLVDGIPLYKLIMQTALSWERQAEIGFVVGATHPKSLAELRQDFPTVPFLIPGVGAQGADPVEITNANANGLCFVNSSRGILYADSSEQYAQRAATEARILAQHLPAHISE